MVYIFLHCIQAKIINYSQRKKLVEKCNLNKKQKIFDDLKLTSCQKK